jgi:hypothetical protein
MTVARFDSERYEYSVLGRSDGGCDVKNDGFIGFNLWWYVKIPHTSENCWLWGMTATTTGNVDEIPIIK